MKKLNIKITDYVLVALFVLAFFTWLQATPYLIDPDGFYHVKIAQQMLANHSLAVNFNSLPLTTLSENYADQQWLYHASLIPFTLFNNPLLGLKIATIIFAVSFAMVLYWLLKQFNVKYPWLFTTLALTSQPLLVRITIAKAAPLGVIIFLISLYLIFKNKPYALALLSLFYVWIHGSWPILLVTVFLYWLIDICWNFFKQPNTLRIKTLGSLLKYTKRSQKLLLSCLLGSTAGLIINPYFPANLIFFWQQTILIALKGYKNIISVGAEWYGFPIGGLITSSFIIFILLVLAIFLFIKNYNNLKKSDVLLLILSGFLFFSTLSARRNVEFFIPIATLFIATQLSKFNRSTWLQAREYINKSRGKLIGITLLSISLGIIASFSIFFNFNSYKHLASKVSMSRYEKSAAWLNANLAEKETIFNSNFDDFPPLFYRLSGQQFVSGLDPVFLYLHDSDKYQLWVSIVKGEIVPQPEKIKKVFNSQILFSKNSNTRLIEILTVHPGWSLSYKDEEVHIFQAK